MRRLLPIAAIAMSVLAAPTTAQDGRVQMLVPHRPIVLPEGQAPVRISAARAEVIIRDRVAITELAITLSNPGRTRAEAQLLLPVPDGSAIRSFGLDGLGDEPTAVLLPAGEARRVYDDIVRRIVDPGLLEFAGLGLIRSSVFPVEPGVTQTFRVTYEQVLPHHAGRIDYVLPRTEALGQTGVEWSISARVEASAPLGPIFSPSHPIEVTTDTPTSARVDVKSPDDPGSFRLTVMHNADRGAITVIAYPDARVADGHGGYFMLVAGPRPEWNQQNTLKREVTLVIDRSGSMRGAKMDQAREAALQVLEGLDEGELFNLIDYSGSVERFAERPQPKNAQTMGEARAYLQALRATGSTNLHDALVDALRQPVAEGTLPLVLFLTDGKATDGVTSEVGIRDAARAANTHQRRVFTFGVGFDVNAPLLTGLAEATRALPTFVPPDDTIEAKVSEVFDRLDGPVLVNPEVAGVLADATPVGRRSVIRDLQPSRLPDMYSGDQITVLGRYTTDRPITVELSGFVSTGPGAEGRLLQTTFDPADATVANAFVPRLWAQRRIADLIGSIRQAGAEGRTPDPELVDEIVRLSTEHGILTEYTSFLAAPETEFARGRDDDARVLAAQTEFAGRELMDRAVTVRGGAGAVAQDMNLGEMIVPAVPYRNSYAYAEPDGALRERTITTVQQTNDRAFFRRGQSRWVEAAALPREADAPDDVVEFATDAYFALVDDLVAQHRQGVIAQRGEVLLLNRGRLVLVRNPA